MNIDRTVYWINSDNAGRYVDEIGIIKPDVPRGKGVITGAYFGERHPGTEDGPFGLNITVNVPERRITFSPTYTKMKESRGLMRALGAATVDQLPGREVCVYFDLETGTKPVGLQRPARR